MMESRLEAAYDMSRGFEMQIGSLKDKIRILNDQAKVFELETQDADEGFAA